MSHSLILHLQDLVHGDDPSAGEVLTVLAHLDGLKPLRHRPEGGTVWAAGAGQTDGYTASKEKSIQMIMINRLSHNKGRWLSTVITVQETSWWKKPVGALRVRADWDLNTTVFCPFSLYLVLMLLHKGKIGIHAYNRTENSVPPGVHTYFFH